MNGNTGLDWNELAAAWRAEPARQPLRETIAARVRRHTIMMWVVTGVELVILASFGVFAWWILREEAGAARITAVSGLVALSLGIQAFALWNRRGSWRSLADSPEAHLDLSERRARAKLRVVVAVRLVAVAQAAAVWRSSRCSARGAAPLARTSPSSWRSPWSRATGRGPCGTRSERRNELEELRAGRALLAPEIAAG